MPSRSTLRLGHVAGVPIGVQPLWLVILGLLTYSLGHDYFPGADEDLEPGAAYLLGLVSALTLFAGILLHELGHAVVARRHGMEVEEIDLWLLGGVARMRGEPRAPQDELRFALAGPAVTAVLLAVAVALRIALGGTVPDWARAALDYQVYVNAVILAFNLLPAFPLDGGRVARALLWRRSGDRETATDRASGLGRGFGMGFVFLGVLSFAGGEPGGLWLVLVGGFLIVAGGVEAQQMRLERAFAGVRAGDLMSAPVATLPATGTLDRAITDGFATHLYSAFPVVDADGRAVGVLSLDDVRAVPRSALPGTRTGDRARTDEDLLVEAGTPVRELLGRPAFERVGRAVVVDRGRRPIGIVSITDVQRRLRADALLAPQGTAAGGGAAADVRRAPNQAAASRQT